MITVLREVFHGKHTIPDPDSFKEKVRQIERAERRKAKKAALEEGLMSMKSASSFGGNSYLNQSQKTGLSGSVSGNSSAAGNSSDEEEGEGTG